MYTIQTEPSLGIFQNSRPMKEHRQMYKFLAIHFYAAKHDKSAIRLITEVCSTFKTRLP